MTEKKAPTQRETTSRAAARQATKGRATGRKDTKTTATAAKPEVKDADAEQPEDGGLTDQVGSVVSKLLELAEAGVDLGNNFFSLLNSLAQNQLQEAVHSGDDAYGVAPARGAPESTATTAGPAPHPEAAAEAEAPGPDASYCIINRLPLPPGGPVQVSFSINNDLPRKKRKLHVAAGGFVGAMHGFELDDRSFSVQPTEKVIAPMDFEKFVLKGKIPKNAPQDSYNGWVNVDGDEDMKIPVVLVVTPPG